MKAGINLCLKKISYTILQKPNNSVHFYIYMEYKKYTVLLYNEDNYSNYISQKNVRIIGLLSGASIKINIPSCSASELKWPIS